MDSLAVCAIDRIGDELAAIGTRVADDAGQAAIGELHRLVVDGLRRVQFGSSVLAALRTDPVSREYRTNAAECLDVAARRDPDLSTALHRAVARAGAEHPAAPQTLTSTGQGNVTIGVQGGSKGDVAGRDVRGLRIGTLNLGRGQLTGLVAVTVVLLGGGTAAVVTSQSPSAETSYQQRVLASCHQVKEVTGVSHSEAFSLQPAIGDTTPTDMLHVRKAALVGAMTDELAKVQAIFADLDRQPVPATLRSRKAALNQAVTAWATALKRDIAVVRSKVSDGMTLTRLQQLKLSPQEGRTDLTDVHLDSTLADLAGAPC